LDPSFKVLLKDIDISLHKARHTQVDNGRSLLRELEEFPDDSLENDVQPEDEDSLEPRALRKSPAAHFGSQKIGAVVIPSELQESIETLISGKPNRI